MRVFQKNRSSENILPEDLSISNMEGNVLDKKKILSDGNLDTNNEDNGK